MTELTPHERAILDKIVADPFIEQQNLAAAVGLSRSTVANYIAQLVQKGFLLGRAYVVADRKRIVCFGGAVMDRKYHAVEPVIAGTSNPASSIRAYGGVARNVAENLARLDVATCMVSAVGDDDSGHGLIKALQLLGVDVSGVSIQAAHSTAEYAAVLQPDNSLAFGIADMAVFDALTIEKLNRDWPLLMSASWVFADCNLPQATLHELIERSRGARFNLAIDAVSVHKVARLPHDLSGIDTLFLNQDEAAGYLRGAGSPEQLFAQLRDRGAASILLTLGENGLLVSDGDGLRHLPVLPADVVDVTGAGDSLVAGTLYGLLNGRTVAQAALLGRHLAKLTVETDGSVRQDLTPDMVEEIP